MLSYQTTRVTLIVEIRQEAVIQALALNKKSTALPMPSKRSSALYARKRVEQRAGMS